MSAIDAADAASPPGEFMLSAGITRGSALALLRGAFSRAGIESAGLDARLLLLDALGISAAELAARPDIALDEAQRTRVECWARQRANGRSLARVVGQREFWGLPFKLGPDTLEPRPDSEAVVAAALSLGADPAAVEMVLDLGTGSGCLLVALLHECRNAFGIGLDRSEGACATAAANARLNGVGERGRFVVGDWSSAITGRFDLIVSNPPYIARGDLAGLSREVSHDPVLALDGGPDGLAAYRRILPECSRLLRPGGAVVVEIGAGQSDGVTAIGAAAGLALVEARPDLSGTVRALGFRA